MMNHWQKKILLSFRCLALLMVISASKAVSNESLQLTFNGEIKALCQFTLQDQRESYDFSKSAAASLPIALYCNQAMQLEIQSEFGGLRKENTEKLIPYSLQIDIANAGIHGRFTSQELLHAVKMDSSNIPYNAYGTMHVSLSEKNGKAGRYMDRIRINIAPKLTLIPQ